MKPTEKTLVQGDSYTTDSILIKPSIANYVEVTIYWKLLAKDFEDEGKLSIKIEPMVHEVLDTHYVHNAEQEREEVDFSLIQRPVNHHMLHGFVDFSNKESDYTFVKV